LRPAGNAKTLTGSSKAIYRSRPNCAADPGIPEIVIHVDIPLDTYVVVESAAAAVKASAVPGMKVLEGRQGDPPQSAKSPEPYSKAEPAAAQAEKSHQCRSPE
jgi:hypothetical protein